MHKILTYESKLFQRVTRRRGWRRDVLRLEVLALGDFDATADFFSISVCWEYTYIYAYILQYLPTFLK